jgi:hypothetical protein
VGSTAVVGAGTAANRLAGLPLRWLASTPRAVGEGRLWLVLTSGLLADDPWLPSLIGFVIVLAVAVWLLSAPMVATVAAAGQVFSALVVYGVIWLTRVVEPHAFASVYCLDDYGTSAMIAAWIGAVARVGWLRSPTSHGRLGVAAGCLACLAIGLACRPDVTFLDAEHLVAFGIGVVALSGSPVRGCQPRRRRRVGVPAAAAAVRR